MVLLYPPVSLTARGSAGLGVSVIFLATCWMTTLLLSIHYGDLMNPVLPWGLLLLLSLNIPEKQIR